jgi:hypothetical protein
MQNYYKHTLDEGVFDTSSPDTTAAKINTYTTTRQKVEAIAVHASTGSFFGVDLTGAGEQVAVD